MPTLSQIEANRRNSQKSTGPRSPEGKAISRFNALKSGVNAKSQVIPGEDASALDALAADYHLQFQPATPLECFLVDSLVNADWQLRRLRRVEAQLWGFHTDAAKDETDGIDEDYPLGHVFQRGIDAFNRLQRRIDSTERSYYRALKELQRCQAGRTTGPPESVLPELASFSQDPEPPPPHPSPAPVVAPPPVTAALKSLARLYHLPDLLPAPAQSKPQQRIA
jgi:hypothetical protein